MSKKCGFISYFYIFKVSCAYNKDYKEKGKVKINFPTKLSTLLCGLSFNEAQHYYCITIIL